MRALIKQYTLCALCGAVVWPACCSTASADTFGSGENLFSIPFVTIGSPGNGADTTGVPNPAGAVPYTYRIGKYEVPEEAIYKANAQSALDGAPLAITLDTRGPQKPATSISWFEAARFVNWLNEEKGAQAAYKFDASGAFQLWEPTDPGYNPANRFRNSLALYFLPSVDEWYKAAFYDPATGVYYDYPTGRNTAPTPVSSGTVPGTAVWNQSFAAGPANVSQAGGQSPFGTLGQSGNVNEWNETTHDVVNSNPVSGRLVRGGDWIGPSLNPLSLSSAFVAPAIQPHSNPVNTGIRIASVPEPASNGIMAAGCVLLHSLMKLGTRRQRGPSTGLSVSLDAPGE